MTTGASWPWNLSTVPTRARPGQTPPEPRDLRVVRRDDEDVVGADRVRACPSRRSTAARSSRSTSSATTSTSSRLVGLPTCCTGTPPQSGAAEIVVPSTSWFSSPGAGAAGPRTRQLRDERADRRVHPVRRSRNSRGRAAWWRAPSSRCSSAETPAPSGWTPLRGWASCCGSPSSTTPRRRAATATALASEICPPRRPPARRRHGASPRGPRATTCRRRRRRRRRQRARDLGVVDVTVDAGRACCRRRLRPSGARARCGRSRRRAP